MNDLPQIGAKVIINSPGHRQDGRTGTVAYIGKFFGTVGVAIDGHEFGLMPSELEAAA